MGNEACKPGDYKEPELPDGCFEVRLSVYRLSMTGFQVIDAVGASVIGAYHSAVVVGGDEYAFGGHEIRGETGVYRSAPEMDERFSFYTRLVMGRIYNTRHAVRKLVADVSRKWPGPSYDLIERNCNHFASDLCWLLVKKRPPAWVNETASNLSRANRRSLAKKNACEVALQKYLEEHQTCCAKASGRHGDVDGSVPGYRAFEATFNSTYDVAYKNGWKEGQAFIDACSEDVDPEQVQRDVEVQVVELASSIAVDAAKIVGRASRKAADARATQPAKGLAAWDAEWQRSSSLLLREWKAAALARELKPEGQPERDMQVEQALAAAAVASSTAAAACEAAEASERHETTDCAWDVECTHQLKSEIRDIDVQVLDESEYCSIRTAVDALNEGRVQCPNGICIVYSKSRAAYFSLYRRDRKEAAAELLSFESQGH
eukprot:TRINITY_DN66469_c0_g1_i1.p1 TRINITY_DN66469_c0_g1~~TRINITY_DN66469_c0_g1_i1.p1  ORF type:complete len:432 (-),score=60.71 TRINITY_DN66469_c0_g1_i1:461-1756(-)